MRQGTKLILSTSIGIMLGLGSVCGYFDYQHYQYEKKQEQLEIEGQKRQEEWEKEWEAKQKEKEKEEKTEVKEVEKVEIQEPTEKQKEEYEKANQEIEYIYLEYMYWKHNGGFIKNTFTGDEDIEYEWLRKRGYKEHEEHLYNEHVTQLENMDFSKYDLTPSQRQELNNKKRELIKLMEKNYMKPIEEMSGSKNFKILSEEEANKYLDIEK